MMLMQPRTFGSLCMNELPKLSKEQMCKGLERIQTVDHSLFQNWYPPGIRAQLINYSNADFVTDFVIELDSFSAHVLNCVSPGWTCAAPFSRYVVDEISRKFRLN